MVMLTMRQDFRAPAFGPASAQEIYAAAFEMWEWADAQRWTMAVVSEHHGGDDGWMPAPLTAAAGLRVVSRILLRNRSRPVQRLECKQVHHENRDRQE